MGEGLTSNENRAQAAYEQQLHDYAAALGWVSGLIAATESGQLTFPTPCAEWDVRMLIGHLIGTAHRGLGTGTGRPASDVPHVVTTVPDTELAPTYRRISDDIVPAFAALAHDTLVPAPWGEVSALAGVQGFTIETTTHGWDLATATGQPADAPPGVADHCLNFAAETVPTRLRGISYEAAIPTPFDVAPTARLARLLGHH